jgi:hypothetical protein
MACFGPFLDPFGHLDLEGSERVNMASGAVPSGVQLTLRPFRADMAQKGHLAHLKDLYWVQIDPLRYGSKGVQIGCFGLF